MPDPAVARRMFEARQDLEKVEGARLTLDEIGKRVAAEEGKSQPYAAPVVQRWIEGVSAPRSIATWRALASVLRVRLGWLANGELPIRDEKEGDNRGDQGGNVPVAPKPTNGTPNGLQYAPGNALEMTPDVVARVEAAKKKRRHGKQ